MESRPVNEKLKVVSLTCDEQAVSNKIYVGQVIYNYFLNLSKNKKPIYVLCKKYVFQQDLDRTCPDQSLRMGKEIRKFLMISQTQDEIDLNHFDIPGKVNFFLSKMTIGVRCPKKLEEKITSHEDIYDKAFKDLYRGHFISEKQNQFTKVEAAASVQFEIESVEFEDTKSKRYNWGIITDETDITFKSRDNKLKIKSKSMQTKSLFKEGFNFEDLEVGGLDDQIQKIFRRAFMTRRLPQEVLDKYGGNHTKGMLLFGPPGTGKTLIARKLSKVLKAKEPKIVNGPEIFNKFVGEAEKAVRDLFADAAKDSQELGDDSPLHVIVFDEFDAIAKPRGMHSDSTGVGDNVVNQLLTMVDGVDSLNNILVIGMTNRKDQIDPAILRPGRFEVHIEVGLPDEAGRQAILKIHTKKMRDSKTLGDDVDLGEIAKMSKNFTGAEIETLVRAACQFGLIRKHNLLNFNEEVKTLTEDAKIEKQDFDMALTEIKPQFGVDEGALDCYLKMPIYEYGDNYHNMYNDLKAKLIGMVNSELRVSSLLQFGDRGVGKTTLACKLAKDSGVPFIKIVSSDMLVGRTEHGKVNKIAEFFTDAYKSKVSLIILDEIERLIEYVMIGSRFSNGLLQALLSYMKKMPSNDEHRIVIIGTSAEKDVIKHFGFNNLFGFKGGINRLYYANREIDFVQNKMIPELAVNNIKLTLSDDFSIPIKDLIFILSSLKFKWNNHMPANWKNNNSVQNSEIVTNWFKMLYSQSK